MGFINQQTSPGGHIRIFMIRSSPHCCNDASGTAAREPGNLWESCRIHWKNGDFIGQHMGFVHDLSNFDHQKVIRDRTWLHHWMVDLGMVETGIPSNDNFDGETYTWRILGISGTSDRDMVYCMNASQTYQKCMVHTFPNFSERWGFDRYLFRGFIQTSPWWMRFSLVKGWWWRKYEQPCSKTISQSGHTVSLQLCGWNVARNVPALAWLSRFLNDGAYYLEVFGCGTHI